MTLSLPHVISANKSLMNDNNTPADELALFADGELDATPKNTTLKNHHERNKAHPEDGFDTLQTMLGVRTKRVAHEY